MPDSSNNSAAPGTAEAAPSRSLSLAGATNFRDLGGYRGQGGRTVRWRRLFRSDHLAGLTEADRAVLTGLGIGRSVDFRGVQERAATACDLPGITQHSLPIEPTVVQNVRSLIEPGRDLTALDAVGVMQQTYRAFASDQSHRFAELFEHLLADDAPLVFHCTAGKDRTGFAAALILLALEVPRPVVMADFLLTNDLYRRSSATPPPDLPQPVLDVLWKVQAGFLESALQVVDAERGGIDAYLVSLGVGPRERERLRQRYLQP